MAKEIEKPRNEGTGTARTKSHSYTKLQVQSRKYMYMYMYMYMLERCTVENLGPRRSKGSVLEIKRNRSKTRCQRDCQESR